MPKLLSHLYVIENILEKNVLNVKNIPQFYIGSLCPDALYNEDTFEKQKKISHLYENLDRTNDGKFINIWKNNVNNFYNKNKLNEAHDFILGYCIHIMSDIYYFINIKPTLEKISNDDIEQIQKEYFSIEFKIFQEREYIKKIISKIVEFNEFNFFHIILKNDMIKLKNDTIDFLSGKYNSTEKIEHKFISFGNVINWNNKMVEYVLEEFDGIKNRFTSPSKR